MYLLLSLTPKYLFLRIPTFLYNFSEIWLYIEELLGGVGSSMRIDRAITQTFFTFTKKANKKYYLGFHDPKKSISIPVKQYSWINIAIF